MKGGLSIPAVITHYLMGKASAGLLGDNEFMNSVKQYGDIFNLGAQGPDILLFALGNKDLNKMGERIHGEGIGNFFAEGLKWIRKAAVHDGRSEIIAYMAGFICHYALDTCTHPYIYYKSGFSDENGLLYGESITSHRFLETTIDCILCGKLEEKNPYSLNISQKLRVGSKNRALIGRFLSDVISSSYGVFIYPEDFIKAMKDIVFVYRMLRDKKGIKKTIARIAGKLLRDYGAAEALIHYGPVKNLDYLNDQRNVWHYPWDDSIDINLSFMDLFKKAAEDSRIYINAFAKAVNKQLDDKIVLSILGNKNFSTGLESPVKFLYYNIEFQNAGKE